MIENQMVHCKKNQLNKKEGSDRENERQKSCKIYKTSNTKWEKLFLISNYFKCKYTELPDQKTEIKRMDKTNYNLTICYPRETQFRSKDTSRVTVKG